MPIYQEDEPEEWESPYSQVRPARWGGTTPQWMEFADRARAQGQDPYEAFQKSQSAGSAMHQAWQQTLTGPQTPAQPEPPIQQQAPAPQQEPSPAPQPTDWARYESAVQRAMAWGASREEAYDIITRQPNLSSSQAEQAVEQWATRAFGAYPEGAVDPKTGAHIGQAQWSQMQEQVRARQRGAIHGVPEEQLRPGAWQEGYFTRQGAHSLYPISALTGAGYWLPGEEPGSVRLPSSISESKLAKRVQLQGAYESLGAYRLSPATGEAGNVVRESLRTQAPFRMGPEAQTPERGVNLRAAIPLVDITPAGQGLLKPGVIEEATQRWVKNIKLPKGFEPTGMPEEGTQWAKGQRITPFEGGTALDIGSWDTATLLGRSIVEGEGGDRALRMVFERGLDPRHGELEAKFLGHKQTLPQAASAASFERMVGGHQDIEALFQYKEALGVATETMLGMPRSKLAGILGVSEEKLGQGSWAQHGPKLVEHFQQNMPEMIRDIQYNLRFSQKEFQAVPEAQRKQWFADVTEREGGYDVRTAPIPTLVPEHGIFTALKRGYPGRMARIPYRELQRIERTDPQEYARIMEEAAPMRQAYGGLIRGTYLSEVGAEAPADAQQLTPELASRILSQAEQRALAATPGAEGDSGNVPQPIIQRQIMSQLARELGGGPIQLGTGQFMADPSALMRLGTAKGALEGGAYGGIERAAARVVQAAAGREEMPAAYGSAVGQFLEAQGAAGSSPGTMAMAMSAIVRRSGSEGTVLGSTALSPHERYRAPEDVLKAYGLTAGSEGAAAFMEQWRTGEIQPLEMGSRFPPAGGDDPMQMRYSLLHPEQAAQRGMELDPGTRLVVSQLAQQAAQGDFDADRQLRRVVGQLQAKEGGGWSIEGAGQASTAEEVMALAKRAPAWGAASLYGGEFLQQVGEGDPVKALQDILDPSGWREISGQRVGELMSEDLALRGRIGGTYNTADPMEEMARRAGGSQEQVAAMAKFFGIGYGVAQRPSPLEESSPELARMYRFLQTGSPATGGYVSQEGEPTSITKVRGYAGTMQGMARQLIQATRPGTSIAPSDPEGSLFSSQEVASMISQVGASEEDISGVAKLVQRMAGPKSPDDFASAEQELYSKTGLREASTAFTTALGAGAMPLMYLRNEARIAKGEPAADAPDWEKRNYQAALELRANMDPALAGRLQTSAQDLAARKAALSKREGFTERVSGLQRENPELAKQWGLTGVRRTEAGFGRVALPTETQGRILPSAEAGIAPTRPAGQSLDFSLDDVEAIPFGPAAEEGGGAGQPPTPPTIAAAAAGEESARSYPTQRYVGVEQFSEAVQGLMTALPEWERGGAWAARAGQPLNRAQRQALNQMTQWRSTVFAGMAQGGWEGQGYAPLAEMGQALLGGEGRDSPLSEAFSSLGGQRRTANVGDVMRSISVGQQTAQEQGPEIERINERLTAFSAGLKDAADRTKEYTEQVKQGRDLTREQVQEQRQAQQRAGQYLKDLDLLQKLQPGTALTEAQQAGLQQAETVRQQGLLQGAYGGGEQRGGLGGALGGIGQNLMSGWGLMQMRRMWGMTGGAAMGAIPVAAQAEMAAAQAASIGLTQDQYVPGQMGMDLMSYQAGRQNFQISMGRGAYGAWGWTQQAMGQGAGTAAGILGPAAGVGLIGGLAGKWAGAGAGVAGLGAPVGAALGLGAAGVGGALYMGNLARDEQQMAIAAAGGGEGLQGLLAKAALGVRMVPGAAGPFLGNIVSGMAGPVEDLAGMVTRGRRITGGEIGAQDLGVAGGGAQRTQAPLGGQDRIAAIQYAVQNAPEELSFMNETQLTQAVSQWMQFNPEDTNIQEIMRKPEFQQMALRGDVGGQLQGATQLGQMWGIEPFEGQHRIRQVMQPMDTWQRARFAEQSRFVAPLARLGVQPEQFADVLSNANVGPQEQYMLGALAQGQGWAWSQMGQQLGINQWQTERGGFTIGTNWGGDILRSRLHQAGGAGQQVLSGIQHPLSGLRGAGGIGDIGLPGAGQVMIGGQGVNFDQWSLQDFARQQQAGHQQWQYGFQMQGLQQQRQYQMAGWGLQDQMTGLQRGWQEQGLQHQEASTMMSLRQTLERLSRNMAKLNVQADWGEEDIRRGYERQQVQFGWAREDLAFRGQQTQLQYGWQMEDLAEAERFATGRDRRRIRTQQERASISFGMQMGRLDTEEERLKQKEQWAEEDFKRELDRHEQRVQWSKQDIEMARRHAQERAGLAMERIQATREHYAEVQELEDEQRELQREEWLKNHERQVEALEKQKEYQDLQKEIETAQLALARTQQAHINDFKHNFEKGGSLRVAMENFVDAMISALNSARSAARGVIP